MLTILHGGLLDDTLLLWAETSDSLKSTSRSRGRNRERAAEALPYGVSVGTLAEKLGEVITDLDVGPASRTRAVAWLPTMQSIPVPSSPMIGDVQPDGELELRPWEVEALDVDIPRAAELLTRGADRRLLAPGLLVSDDLKFLAKVLRFAASLVVEEQFLPDVRSTPEGYAARWRPHISGERATSFHELVKGMPLACVAISRESKRVPPDSRRRALSGFVDRIVDSMVRESAFLPTEPVRRRGHRQLDNVHDRWIRALSSPDSRLEGSREELEGLAAEIGNWRRTLDVEADASFRICFMLEEPPGSEDGSQPDPSERSWRLNYLVQSTDDPSLLLSIGDVWRSGRRVRKPREIAIQVPRTKLLAALGRAAVIYDAVKDSLQTSEPEGIQLDTSGAWDFLIEKAWLLEQAGFGVLLPSWWTRKGTKARLSAKARLSSSRMVPASGITHSAVAQFDYQVALGDDVLSYDELEELARLKVPLVRMRGRWVQVNPDEIVQAMEFWKQRAERPVDLSEAIGIALGAANEVGGLPIENVETEGWLTSILEALRDDSKLEALQLPEGFRGALRPYQQKGYSWLGFLSRLGLGACLADDMGLGKTVQTLALIQRERANGNRVPVLLICPTSVVNNWREEAARFTPDLEVMVHHGPRRRKGKEFVRAAGEHAVVVSTYALLPRDPELFKQVRWRAIVLDEAQNIKNAGTKQARAARALEASYRLALTGTPVENSVGDLWSIMTFLNPGLLGNQAEFRRRFFLPIQAEQDTEAASGLKKLTGPFILRRLKTDPAIITDLPEKIETKVYCNLTKEQASLYAATLEEMDERLEEAEGIGRRGLILGTLTRLKQICNHPAQFLGESQQLNARSGKLERLDQLLEEALEVDDRMLVFTQYAEMGGLLKRYLEERFGRETLFLHGGVSRQARTRMIRRFQEEAEGPPVFVLSLRAGGTGLNLTRANHVLHFDRWWNPAVENQATDRAFRIGQHRSVQVHKFVCAGTLEERIDQLIESKQEIASRVVGTGEDWITELSTEEIKDLFALSADAVEE